MQQLNIRTGSFSRRRFLQASASLLAAVPALAACASVAPSTGSPGQTAPTSQERTKIVRSFWGSPDQIAVQRENDARFHEAHPEIEVEPIAVPWGQYREKLMTMIAGGESPDIMHVDAYWMPNFVERNMLLALDEFIESDPNYPPELISGIWPIPDHHQVNGQTYSIVTTESPRIIFYNETMFKEAGLATPMELAERGEWNWDTYLESALQLTNQDGNTKTFGAPSYITNAWRYVFIHSNGGRILNEDKTQCVISMPETMEALQFQVDLLHTHRVSPLPEESEVLGGNTQAFMAQRLAMTLDGIWVATSFRQIEDFEWAAAPVPASPNTGYARTNYKPNATSMPSAIPANHRDAAWTWLSFDPLGQNRLNIDRGATITAFAENLDYFYQSTPVRNAHVIYDHFANNEITYLPLNTTWFEWEKVVADQLTLVIGKEQTLEEAVAVIEPQVNEILATASL